jgi:hypothetical protein
MWLFNGKQERIDEIIYLEILFTGPRQKSATPYLVNPLAAELDPVKPRRRLKGVKFKSQGVEEKENSFNVQVQIFQTVKSLLLIGSIVWGASWLHCRLHIMWTVLVLYFYSIIAINHSIA